MTDVNEDSAQRERIKRLVNEMSPDCVVRFDPDSPWIRFRVELGRTLMESSAEYHASQLEDMSDDQLRTLIRRLSSGKL